MLKVEAWTDGGVSKKPKDSTGDGKYGFKIYVDGKLSIRESFTEQNTTNNRMEMKSIFSALERLEKIEDAMSIVIKTDSNNSINWIRGTFKCNTPEIVSILESILEILSRMQSAGVDVRFEKIDRALNNAHNLGSWR